MLIMNGLKLFFSNKNHNLLNISNDTKGIDLTMSKILRDADKWISYGWLSLVK